MEVPLRRYVMQHLSASSLVQAPLSAINALSGMLRGRSGQPEAEGAVAGGGDLAPATAAAGEVSIRIIGVEDREGRAVPGSQGGGGGDGVAGEQASSMMDSAEGDSRGADGEAGGAGDGPYQRYDIQLAARWLEQALPFSLLLLVVFIRQHLQGFFITVWIAAVMFKSNNILRNQTALKGERNLSVLFVLTIVFLLHIVGAYWWYRNDDLPRPLVMLPPQKIPSFWHAVFIIMVNGLFPPRRCILGFSLFFHVQFFLIIIVNHTCYSSQNVACSSQNTAFSPDTLVRLAAMAFKCGLLMYYKNRNGRNYRKQGQVLTLVEYSLLLYRALLPAPVWYRFFLNKEYGSLFSSLITGLYLTFKLTSIVEKVQSLFLAMKVFSRKEVHYGSCPTKEQIIAAGDLCAICQEKIHVPILLRCKHIFCEDCLSEWFERERTCPLCRAVVKPAELQSFADGSTSLFFQLF